LNEIKKTLFLTVLAGILWGSSFSMIKIGLKFIDVYMFAFLGEGFTLVSGTGALLILLAIILVSLEKQPKS